MTTSRFFCIVIAGILFGMLTTWSTTHGTTRESESPSRTVHILAGSGISHVSGNNAGRFPFRGGLLAYNLLSIGQRSLHIGMMVDYGGSEQRADQLLSTAAGIHSTSSHGLNLESNILYSLIPHGRGNSNPDLYVGITTGAYHRVFSQTIYVSAAAIRADIDQSNITLAPRFSNIKNASRWNYSMGAICGVMIRTPRHKSPLYISSVVVEVRYRRIFNAGTDLIPDIRNADQLGFYVSGTWKLW